MGSRAQLGLWLEFLGKKVRCDALEYVICKGESRREREGKKRKGWVGNGGGDGDGDGVGVGILLIIMMFCFCGFERKKERALPSPLLCIY